MRALLYAVKCCTFALKRTYRAVGNFWWPLAGPGRPLVWHSPYQCGGGSILGGLLAFVGANRGIGAWYGLCARASGRIHPLS